MPKIIDYAGRFAFFELASFALVRDHGVDRLSRHAVARVLGTSISTVRRLLNPEADLRRLALNEVEVRRRARRVAPRKERGAEAGLRLLRPWIPTSPTQIAEELVWWRLAVAAPTTAAMPGDHEDDEGPLHHRFAMANHGFVPSDVLHAALEPPRRPTSQDGLVDPVVDARHQHDQELAARLEVVVRTIDPALGPAEVDHRAKLLHALVDGLSVAVCLGRLGPPEASDLMRTHVERMVGT